jgi:hypothetical protein
MAAESEEFERAWAQIVADLTSDTDAELARLARGEDSLEELEEAADSPDAAVDVTPETETSEPIAAGRAGEQPSVTDGERVAEADPGAFVENWSDEGHFTAPPPPELPAGSPATRLGWAGTLGGIATLVLVTLTGWNVPRVVMWAAGLATLAGFVTLVWQLPDSRDDGWDDGAQV